MIGEEGTISERVPGSLELKKIKLGNQVKSGNRHNTNWVKQDTHLNALQYNLDDL